VNTKGNAVAAALMTPPHNLLLSRQPPEAIRALVDELAKESVQLPGVMAENGVARLFAELWSRSTSVCARLRMGMPLHVCTEVAWCERADGEFHPADADDVPLLSAWRTAFEEDVFDHRVTLEPEPIVRQFIDDRSLFVWTDSGEVVSSAAVSRPTRTGIAVSYVYTPPEFRGRGYATSCVAELTARQLRAGRQFCCLYTDLANPTSNAIYAKIGYRPVCNSEWWEFGES
jgi:predicted GNAT family acetyltransferase